MTEQTLSALEQRVDTSLERNRALIAGALIMLVSIVGAFFNVGEFFRSYLLGYLFCIGIALGSMAILMVQYLSGGAWGVVSRRVLEAGSRTLPLMAVLFVPIVFGLSHLYPWTDRSLVDATDVMRHRSVYMNSTLFIVRAVVYSAIWITLSFLLNRWSLAEKTQHGLRVSRRLEALSAPGLILYVFTVTFASVDWAESLSIHFFSTMWGFLFVASQGLAALSFAIVSLALLSRREPARSALRSSHFHDLGKLLLMFVMLWAYFAFSQMLIIWSGNLPGEIPWYVPRFFTSWRWVGITLLVMQFTLPFLLLLSRRLKRSPMSLAWVGGLLLLTGAIDLYWIVIPEFHYGGVHLNWMNITVPIAMFCIWIAAFLWEVSKRPLFPLGAPNLEEALQHGE